MLWCPLELPQRGNSNGHQDMVDLKIGERFYMIVINYVSLTVALNVFNWDQLWQLMTD